MGLYREKRVPELFVFQLSLVALFLFWWGRRKCWRGGRREDGYGLWDIWLWNESNICHVVNVSCNCTS